MKNAATLIILALFAFHLHAQGPVPFSFKNNLQLELGGHGLFYSVNFERLLINEPAMKMTARAGASFYPPGSGIIGLWLPLSVNGLRSFGRHHFEFGIGQIVTRDRINEPNRRGVDDWEMLGSLNIGYRFQEPDGRFLFRVAFTPFVPMNFRQGNNDGAFNSNSNFDSTFIPSGGLSLGYAF